MTREIDQGQRREIVRQWLNGEEKKAVAENLGVSYNTVRNVTEEAKKGRYWEYANYLLYLDDLHELSHKLKARNLSLDRAIAGVQCLDLLVQLSIDPSDLNQFLRLWRRLSPQKVRPEDYSKAALNLAKLEGETGLTFQELDNKATNLKNEVSKLELARDNTIDEIKTLESKREDSQKNYEHAMEDEERKLKQSQREVASQLAAAKVTEVKLATYHVDKAALAVYGLGPEDPGRLLKVFKECETHGFNSKSLIDFISRIASLSIHIDDCTRELEQAQNTLNQKQAALDSMDRMIGTKARELDDLELEKFELTTNNDKLHKVLEIMSLQFDLTQAFLSLLLDPANALDEQLLKLRDLLNQTVTSRREASQRKLLVDYAPVRETLRFLLETVGGRALVWRDTISRETVALRNRNAELTLGILAKHKRQTQELDRKRAEIVELTQKFEASIETKLLRETLRREAKRLRKADYIVYCDCSLCMTRSAIIPGPKVSPETTFDCPSCGGQLEPAIPYN